MSNAALMLPVFAQIALTFAVLIKMGSCRVAALKNREVTLGDVALGGDAWSNNVKKVSNNFNNQFQIPILFFAVAAFFMVTGKVDLVAIVLAWAFVASRCVHSFIHIRANDVRQRFKVYVIGVFIVMALWIWLALKIYLIG